MIFNDSERNNKLRKDILERFISGVMTDDERAKLFGLPEGCRIRENAKIISPENFKCGKYVWIGEGAILDASGGLEIGDHTTIASTVYVWTHSSHLSNLGMRNYSGNPLIERKPTKIGSGVFIGGPSVVYYGTTIGDKVVVLPLSSITTDIPSNCLVGGSPAKVIKTLTDEYIDSEVKRVLEKNGIKR